MIRALLLVFSAALLSTSAKAQGPIQLSKPLFHYSYKEGRNTQRYLNYKRRHYQRQERRELADLRRKHRRHQLYFNRHHKRKE